MAKSARILLVASGVITLVLVGMHSRSMTHMGWVEVLSWIAGVRPRLRLELDVLGGEGDCLGPLCHFCGSCSGPDVRYCCIPTSLMMVTRYI